MPYSGWFIQINSYTFRVNEELSCFDNFKTTCSWSISCQNTCTTSLYFTAPQILVACKSAPLYDLCYCSVITNICECVRAYINTFNISTCNPNLSCVNKFTWDVVAKQRLGRYVRSLNHPCELVKSKKCWTLLHASRNTSLKMYKSITNF